MLPCQKGLWPPGNVAYLPGQKKNHKKKQKQVSDVQGMNSPSPPLSALYVCEPGETIKEHAETFGCPHSWLSHTSHCAQVWTLLYSFDITELRSRYWHHNLPLNCQAALRNCKKKKISINVLHWQTLLVELCQQLIMIYILNKNILSITNLNLHILSLFFL